MEVSGQTSVPNLFTTGLIALQYMSTGWLRRPHGLRERSEERGNYFACVENLFQFPPVFQPVSSRVQATATVV